MEVCKVSIQKKNVENAKIDTFLNMNFKFKLEIYCSSEILSNSWGFSPVIIIAA